MVLVQGPPRSTTAIWRPTARATSASRPRSCRRPDDAAARPAQAVLAWYYTRIYIHVRPERVYVWPGGDIAAEPTLYDAHMEEVRSGHSEEPPRSTPRPSGGVSAWDERIAELGSRYRTAVLSLVSPDGFPFAVRVPVALDAAARWVRIEGEPSGIPFAPGLACLTAHEHAPEFNWQRNFQVRGDLVSSTAPGRWSPTGSSAGSSSPAPGSGCSAPPPARRAFTAPPSANWPAAASARRCSGPGLLGGDHMQHGVDQREVGERLGVVAEVAATARVEFLGV